MQADLYRALAAAATVLQSLVSTFKFVTIGINLLQQGGNLRADDVTISSH